MIKLEVVKSYCLFIVNLQTIERPDLKVSIMDLFLHEARKPVGYPIALSWIQCSLNFFINNIDEGIELYKWHKAGEDV